MSDPKRIKDKAHINAKVRFKPTGEEIELYTLIDGKFLKSTPPELVRSIVEQDISKISDKPSTVLYSMATSFAYSEKEATDDFDFGSVLVEACLPYCLHLPNYADINVMIPEEKIKAVVTLRKIWTTRAKNEEGNSDNVDYYTEQTSLYFKGTTILGPRMPFNPEDGWDSYITGKNIEKINDQNGVFRYSLVYIQLDLAVPQNVEKLPEKQRDDIIKSIKNMAVQVVNRLIDNYRDITNEIYVRRLGDLKVNMIYFKSENIGFYMANMNITTAMMNRPNKEIKELNSRMITGVKPELYKLLLLNSKNSLLNKDYTQAIVESFQALEIFLEDYLVAEFIKNGTAQIDYTKLLEKNWRTKTRLNEILKSVKGISLNSQKNIWDAWTLRYDKTRNEVLHGGYEPTEKETNDTLEINEKVISWIRNLK